MSVFSDFFEDVSRFVAKCTRIIFSNAPLVIVQHSCGNRTDNSC